MTRIQRDHAGNITRQTALTGGSWLVRSESGQEILTLQLPESITMGMFGESAWTVYQGQVVNVNVIPQDYAREILYFNLAATQALTQALQAHSAYFRTSRRARKKPDSSCPASSASKPPSKRKTWL